VGYKSIKTVAVCCNSIRSLVVCYNSSCLSWRASAAAMPAAMGWWCDYAFCPVEMAMCSKTAVVLFAAHFVHIVCLLRCCLMESSSCCVLTQLQRPTCIHKSYHGCVDSRDESSQHVCWFGDSLLQKQLMCSDIDCCQRLTCSFVHASAVIVHQVCAVLFIMLLLQLRSLLDGDVRTVC
jgi:hypothetical protein